MAAEGIVGANELVAIARAVKASGDAQLRKDMLRGLRRAVKPMREAFREAAVSNLPHEGGLNAFVASAKVAPRNRVTGKNAAVRLQGKKAGHDLEAIDRGRVRHPVYGHRDRWVLQQIDAGVWSETLLREAPKARREVVTVLTEIAERLARRG